LNSSAATRPKTIYADGSSPPRSRTHSPQQPKSKFNDLQAQQADIARDLQIIEEDWRDTLRKGEDTGLIGERRRHRQTELDENAGAIAQVRAWIEEVEAELRRQAPHEQFDGDLAAHAADVAAYSGLTGQLDGIHEKAVQALEAAVLDLYGQIATARQRSDQLAARTHQLQATAAELGRTDHVPGPPDWVRPLEHALRGGPHWLLYLASVQARQPTALIRALADAVTNRMTEQLKSARSR
jgi:chromosome segregation ATPase